MKCLSNLWLAGLICCAYVTPTYAQPTPTTAQPAPTTPEPASPTEEADPAPKKILEVAPAYDAIEQRKLRAQATLQAKSQAAKAALRVARTMGKTYQQVRQQRVALLQERLAQVDFAPKPSSPRLDAFKRVDCVALPEEEGRVKHLRAQCDETTKTCLVARDARYSLTSPPKATYKRAQRLTSYCTNTPNGLYDSMEAGYALVPAKLDTTYGFGRDEFNRTFQTHFDLRARFGVGVSYVGNILPGAYSNTMGLEVFGVYENWDQYARTRRRVRFLEGRLSLAPFFARATVFETEQSEQSEEPLLFVATMVGTPRRYDINLDLHPALTLGRLDYRTIEGEQYSQLDIAEGRLQWELLRSMDMEDYVLIHAGAGLGTRRWTDSASEPVYLYPQIGARGAWTLSPRGLLELQAEANMRWGREFDGEEAKWVSATSAVGLEWLVLSLSNQPLTLFARHEWEYMNLEGTDRDIKAHTMRWSVGARISLFVPPPTRPLPTKETTP